LNGEIIQKALVCDDVSNLQIPGLWLLFDLDIDFTCSNTKVKGNTQLFESQYQLLSYI